MSVLLLELEREVSSCKKCELAGTRKRTVFGAGPHDADIMIVGEAPGRTEDETGKPFVGRAGKLLDRMLHVAGIVRQEVFITSVLKCFPPKGIRQPHIKNCMPYLEEQLRQMNPKFVILLGLTAAKAVLGIREGMASVHGRIFEQQGFKFFVTYHPAAAVRLPWKYAKPLEEDFEKIKLALKKSEKQ